MTAKRKNLFAVSKKKEKKLWEDYQKLIAEQKEAYLNNNHSLVYQLQKEVGEYVDRIHKLHVDKIIDPEFAKLINDIASIPNLKMSVDKNSLLGGLEYKLREEHGGSVYFWFPNYCLGLAFDWSWRDGNQLRTTMVYGDNYPVEAFLNECPKRVRNLLLFHLDYLT